MLAMLVVTIAMTACGGMPPAVPAASTVPSTAGVPENGPSTATPRPLPSLQPAAGEAWFGMNLDWGSQTVDEVAGELGVTPAVWVQFVKFPLDDAGRGHLDGFFEQVGSVGGVGLVTLEPHDGLDSITAGAAEELAALLRDAWDRFGVPTIVRFAHEMNGSWYPWGQQPTAYVTAFRTVADAVHEDAPASAMLWAPNEGAGYPFSGGAFGADASSPDIAALDTDRDGSLSRADDPYAPYWPGGDVVDWVGMSAYFWGLEYPWGENEMAPEGWLAAQLTGQPTGAHRDEVAVPDFYAVYAEGEDKPLAITETAALFDPAGGGPTEAEVKSAWFDQVFSREIRERFPRIAMINWFEWRKLEPEVGREIDWRLGSDPALARRLLDGVPSGWLRFADD
jgi:hypothetical protein